MAQRNQIRGNTIVPLTDHFGFGLPGADGTVDSSTGARIIAVNGDPNVGAIPAPKGSIALDYATPTVWQAVDAVGTWADVGSSAVTSVFARTGAVVAAASDYDASQVDNDSGVPGAFVSDALDNLAAQATSVDTVFESLSRAQFGGTAPSANLASDDIFGWGICACVDVVKSVGSDDSGINSVIGKYINLKYSAGTVDLAWMVGINTIAANTTNPLSSMNLRPRLRVKESFTQVVTARHFIGFSCQLDTAQLILADAPASDYFGFQWSNGAGGRADTNWMFVRDGNALGGGPSAPIDTGVALVSDVALIFDFDVTATTVRARLYNTAMVELWDSGLISTNLPGATRPLRYGAGSHWAGVAASLDGQKHYNSTFVNRTVGSP